MTIGEYGRSAHHLQGYGRRTSVARQGHLNVYYGLDPVVIELAYRLFREGRRGYIGSEQADLNAPLS